MFSYFLFIVLFVLILFFIGSQIWLKNRKKAAQPFPENWRTILAREVLFYKKLNTEERARFEQEIQYFLHDVTITGVEIAIDDTDRLLVAASAVIPLFGFRQLRYRNIDEVLLYKGNFNADNQTEGKDRTILGKVGSGDMHRLMILSRPALHQGFEAENNNWNVGIHEFVHLIDKADGATDGIPESIMHKQYVVPWLKLVHEEIKNIKQNDSDINPYGATNEAEFFSVVSEYFFTQPTLFQKEHPKLYELIASIYRQNPE